MSDDLSQELRAFEASEALANGDFSVCIRGADCIESQAARIAELEAALNQAKQHFVADEPLKAFVEICAALAGGEAVSDDVKRLWDARTWFKVAKTFEAQADRIAELEAALKRIEDTDPDEGTPWFHEVARAALTGGKDE